MNIAQMEQHLTDRLGVQVEITIRGEKNFTFEIDSVDAYHADAMIKMFKEVATPTKVDIATYVDIGMQYVYIDI